MQMNIKRLIIMMLAFTFVLSIATGALATEEEHIHNWVLQDGSFQGHTMVCDGCGNSKLENHTLDSSGICTVCGFFVQHTHDWQFLWSDDHWHCLTCSGCGKQKTNTHSKDSAGICKVCGYTPHEHIWQYTQGENYSYNHGLNCTQCAAKSFEDHIYGNDGKCTVCGNSPPHEHQWEWDGNKSNYLRIHFLVCSCGASTSEHHKHFAWNGKAGYESGHSANCGVCGFAMILEHSYDSAYFNGERCTVCGYPGQGTTVPQTKPGETDPVETRPAESKPNETAPVETRPAESKPNETAPVETRPAESKSNETAPVETRPAESKPNETAPVETEPAESEPNETAPVETETAETQAKEMECTESESTQSEPPSSETTTQNAEEKESQHGSSILVWVAVILAAVGGLVAVVLFMKKKSY